MNIRQALVILNGGTYPKGYTSRPISYEIARRILLLTKEIKPDDSQIRTFMADWDKRAYGIRQSRPLDRRRRQRVIVRPRQLATERVTIDLQIPAIEGTGSLAPANRKGHPRPAYRGPIFGPVKTRRVGSPYKRPPLHEENT